MASTEKGIPTYVERNPYLRRVKHSIQGTECEVIPLLIGRICLAVIYFKVIDSVCDWYTDWYGNM